MDDGTETAEAFRPSTLPGNLFTLFDEAMAVVANGPQDQVKPGTRLSVKSLRSRFSALKDVDVYEFAGGSLHAVKSTRVNDIVKADLKGGHLYVLVMRPSRPMRDTYHTLCRIGGLKGRVSPAVNDRICQVILCTPERFRGDQLFDKVPELKEFQSFLGVDNRTLGGWGGPGSGPCARCFHIGTDIVPIECSPGEPGTPPAPPARPVVIDIIPLAASGETNQDSEPFLAIDGSNPSKLAASAFTPAAPGTTAGRAPIYVSLDGGTSWTLKHTLPSTAPLGTYDITIATSGDPDELYAGILDSLVGGDPHLKDLHTPDLAANTLMSELAGRAGVDQPFVQAATHDGTDHVFTGLNDFDAADGRTASLDVYRSGTSVATLRLESRNTSGQNGPSVRPAIARDGTVYAAYFGWRSFDGSIATSDVVVTRDDSWGTTVPGFGALVDPVDGKVGARAATGVKIPWSNQPTLGNERIGSTLALAVDPGHSERVFVAWADRVGNGDIYTIHLRASGDRGLTWSADRRTIKDATCASLAVAQNGTVGLLYSAFVVGNPPRWKVTLEQSSDGFTSVGGQMILADFPDETEVADFLPLLGDYGFLLAVGNNFHGIFSANNTPDLGHFPQGVQYQRRVDFATKRLLDENGSSVARSIDPFYFRVAVR